MHPAEGSVFEAKGILDFAVTILLGAFLLFQVQPLIAFKPWPPSGMMNVDPNQDLTWEKGLDAIFHVVYFGDNFDTVSNATGSALNSSP